jgi:precorrin-6x reductase
MTDVVLFGGTTEGRELTDLCGRAGLATVVCVATSLGARLSPSAPGVRFRVGRMDAAAIAAFLRDTDPRLVVDATHPYAAAATANIAAAARETGLPLIRVARPSALADASGAAVFHYPDLEALIDWLGTTTGTVFCTTGVKEARALTRLSGFADRLYLRLLPVAAGIAACTALGYPTAHLIAMQGPFGEELNTAMFRATGASILVTKDSGVIGGLPQKLAAAAACGMTTAIIDRPDAVPGVDVEQAWTQIQEALA